MVEAIEKCERGIVLVGLARDCAAALVGMLSFCEELEALFPNIDFVFVENSSEDNTREILNSWREHRSNCNIIDPAKIDDEESRTARIARCRNVAMDFVNGYFADKDFQIVVDMDLGLTAKDAAAVSDAVDFILSRSNIAAVFPNSKPLYYDIFALRHPFWCPNDVWQEVEQAWRDWRNDEEHQVHPEDIFVRSRQLLIPADLPPIKVDSAFGGIGIYRWDLTQNSRYRGSDNKGRETCEHVEFHKTIAGDKYILPFWCIEAPCEHLSSGFRTEFALERDLRLRRSRFAFRNRLSHRFPMLRSLLKWAIR